MRTDVILSRIGLAAVAVYCLLCALFYSSFAETHLAIDALPFPVFISEILLFFCFIIFLALVWKGRQDLSRSTVVLLAGYFSWVVGKALINYAGEGPLSFRNAALYYYPATAVFTYVFYRRAQLRLNVLMVAGVLAVLLILWRSLFIWYWLTCGVIVLIALLNVRRPWLRGAGWLVCFFLVIYSLPYLYRGPRAHVLAMASVALFLFFYYAFLWVKGRDILRLGIASGLVVVFIAGLMIFADHSSVSSVISYEGVRSKYTEYDRQVQRRMPFFTQKDLSVHLYHPNETLPVPQRRAWWQWWCKAKPEPEQKEPARPLPSAAVPVQKKSVQQDIKDVLQLKVETGRSSRPLELNQNNIVFRLLVWRDMKDEMIRNRAWWGFGFGHPQRSPSLEVLDWATSEWNRDGWITPHNSFFHVIYRAGILGLCFVGVFFFLIIKMVRDFQRLNSSVGGLLVAGLVYWIVVSNFSVTLEFPYNAILFWGWFGMTMAYRDQLAGQQGQGAA